MGASYKTKTRTHCILWVGFVLNLMRETERCWRSRPTLRQNESSDPSCWWRYRVIRKMAIPLSTYPSFSINVNIGKPPIISPSDPPHRYSVRSPTLAAILDSESSAMKTFQMHPRTVDHKLRLTYDPWIGLRTAGILGGCMILVIVYILYKWKCRRTAWTSTDQLFIEKYKNKLQDRCHRQQQPHLKGTNAVSRSTRQDGEKSSSLEGTTTREKDSGSFSAVKELVLKPEMKGAASRGQLATIAWVRNPSLSGDPESIINSSRNSNSSLVQLQGHDACAMAQRDIKCHGACAMTVLESPDSEIVITKLVSTATELGSL